MSKSEQIELRTLLEAKYFIKNRCTIRECAKAVGVSKSTVHKDLTQRLPEINGMMYRKVSDILKINLNERHIRGGESTRRMILGRKAS